MIFKVASVFLVMAVAINAMPSDPYQPKEVPKPYSFAYGVQDEYAGNDFGHSENADAQGSRDGSFSVQLPDGRKQTVTYTADHENGYNAQVEYYGEAQYAPHSPPFVVRHKPTYH